MTSIAAIRLIFLLDAAMITSWLPRVPDLKAALGVDAGELGLALMGAPLGIIVMLPFAGAIVARFSERVANRIGFVWLAIVSVLPGQAFDLASLGVALFLFGTGIAVMEIAMNTAADAIEHHSGRRIMSSCHGMWSVGALCGGLIGTAAATIGLSLSLQLIIAAPLILAAALSCARFLPLEHPPKSDAPAFAMPSRAMLILGVIPFASSVLEGGMSDWSAVFMRQVHDAGPVLTGAGFIVFTGAMAIARFAGDRLIEQYGPIRCVVGCGVAGLLGLIVLGFSPHWMVSLLGFALMGLAAAYAFPVSMTAAARRGDRPAAQNVASVALLAFLGFVVGPPVVGFLTDGLGIAAAFLALSPLALLMIVGARALAFDNQAARGRVGEGSSAGTW